MPGNRVEYQVTDSTPLSNAYIINLADAIEITRSMILSAKVGGWDKLIALELTRSERLAHLDVSHLDAAVGSEIDYVEFRISELIALNNELIGYCEGQSRNIQGEIERVDAQQAAISAYQEGASF